MPESVIFKAAIKLPPAERAAYLDDACDGNAALRLEVEALLKAHDSAGDFMQRPPIADVTATVSGPERPGSIIGPYKLLQEIGEGGMGTVFLAEQTEPVRRKVALKIIKAGLNSAQVISRFEAERQALALMDHPNIAKVLDAGATNDRPYFVMELVKGVPITEYCDQNRLTPRQRLELFVPVCPMKHKRRGSCSACARSKGVRVRHQLVIRLRRFRLEMRRISALWPRRLE
jgi:hypothetical protein